MKLDSKAIGLILTFLTSCGGGITWLYGEAKDKGKLEAEVELNKKYENVVTDNLRYKFVCKCE